jgi:arsenate reductase
MTTTLYGIPNCDTVKKARTWLAEHGQDFVFHDFKKQGLDRETVAGWLEQLDWDVLVNRKGTTWRKLSDERRKASSRRQGQRARADAGKPVRDQAPGAGRTAR